MKKYRKRVADEITEAKLEGKGAVLIEGLSGVVKPQLQNNFLLVFVYG
mgnify:CR=1 FL=1